MLNVIPNTTLARIASRLKVIIPSDSTFASVSQRKSCERRLHTTSHCQTQHALTIWKDLRELRSSPAPALVLGLSGLIPFAAAPYVMASQGIFLPEMASAQLMYGSTILSFLGGVRWGMLVVQNGPIHPTWMQYSWSVTPSLIAWGALLMPASWGCVTTMTGLGLAGYLDLVQYGYPPWFKGLRFVLTSVAILSLWSTLMCKFLLNEKEKKNSEK